MRERQIESDYVIYVCKKCGAMQRVDVRPRGAEEEVVSWVDDVSETCDNHHQINTPQCPFKGVDLELIIPVA
jgi:RNase P subunit RPR2